MDSSPAHDSASSTPVSSAIYFDGTSSRRHAVTLVFNGELGISEDGQLLAVWPYADVRRADSQSGTLRLTCLTAPSLARLEIRDPALAAELIARCSRLDEDVPGQRGVAKIVGWSIAAVISIVGVIWFGVPLAADRLTPLVPQALERRLGSVADRQITTLFGAKVCTAAAGQAAFNKLITALREAAAMDTSVEAAVLATPVPNALALPGGKIYLFEGLLAKAQNPDEVAGILAHELGHLRHRDHMRNLIYNGGTSFLIGLLFGDITGSSALIFASRSIMTASYTREAEQGADTFSIDLMQKLGRPIKPMGELLFRVTGKQNENPLSILASHPLTEDRLKRMSEVQQTSNGPPLLTPQEWTALKAICSSKG
jgi:Zn-dependent protease with chaperone function